MEYIEEKKRQTKTSTVSIGDSLTEREEDILRQLFSGRCSTEIAEQMQVSKRTVDFHLARAYAKMGVSNRYDAFKKAVELGIISD